MSNIFADIVDLTIQSGNGGGGAVSFRREKFIPKGGPDGGDGGAGGSVYVCADPNEKTLYAFRLENFIKAEDGQSGMKYNRHGKDGNDVVLRVPLGSCIKNEFGAVLAEINAPTDKVLLLKGGRGGKGNTFFKSSVNQAPRRAQEGENGESLQIGIELELIADIGFVGVPNVGKSTLLRSLTKANPKVGNYPFTTIIPNLGTLRNYEREIILADIPGLIKGAAQGHGLGSEFLKHIKKTSGLAFVLDGMLEDWGESQVMSDELALDGTHNNYAIFADDKELLQEIHTLTLAHLVSQYEVLVHELFQYDPSLLEKNQLIIINRIDMSLLSCDTTLLETLVSDFKRVLRDKKGVFPQISETVLAVSSFTKFGLHTLQDMFFEFVKTVAETEDKANRDDV